MKTLISTFFMVLITSFAFSTPQKKQINMRILEPGGLKDEAAIYFDLGIRSVYNSLEDGLKVWSTIPNKPGIYSFSSDSMPCSTNGYSPLNSSEKVSIGIKTAAAGNYQILASSLSNFDPTTILQLEDKLTNTFTNLRTGWYTVQLAQNETINGRFILHISYPVQFSSVTAGCANNDGILLIRQDSTLRWTSSELYDSLSHSLGSFTNISGAYSFNNLPEGDYYLVMTFGNYSTSKSLHVDGHYVGIHIQPTLFTAGVGEKILFQTSAFNVVTYEWILGDGTWINGVANPTYSYSVPGSYKVLLTCTNVAGCVSSDSVLVTIHTATDISTVTVQSRKVSASSKIVKVVLGEEIKQGVIQVYNLLGQSISSQPITESTTLITLSASPVGYYIVSVENDNRISTSRIFMGQ